MIYKITVRIWFEDGEYLEKVFTGENAVQWSYDGLPSLHGCIESIIIDVEN